MTAIQKRLGIALGLSLAAILCLSVYSPRKHQKGVPEAQRAAVANASVSSKTAVATEAAFVKHTSVSKALKVKKAEADEQITRIVNDPIVTVWADQPLPPGIADWLYHTPNRVEGSDAPLYTTEVVPGDSR
jgi:hypothetical protein